MVIANELIERKMVELMFVNLGVVSERVKKTFDDDGRDRDLFEDMKTVELLIIDDLGIEKMSDWLREKVYLLVNHRYENRLPMIFTSNQSLEQVETLYMPQIASRIREMCKVLKMSGEDRRKNMSPDF